MKIGNIPIAVLLLVLVGGVGLVSLARSEAQTAAGTAPVKVAVCNLVQVFGEYQRAKDLTKDLDDQRMALEAENKKRTERSAELRTELEGYKVGSPKHDETLQKAQRHEIDRRVWIQMQQEAMLRKHRRLTEEMYKDIRAAVAAVAKDREIEVVVQLESGDLAGAQNIQELVSQMDRQKVLYAAPQADITALVLQRLNEGYRLQKK